MMASAQSARAYAMRAANASAAIEKDVRDAPLAGVDDGPLLAVAPLPYVASVADTRPVWGAVCVAACA